MAKSPWKLLTGLFSRRASDATLALPAPEASDDVGRVVMAEPSDVDQQNSGEHFDLGKDPVPPATDADPDADRPVSAAPVAALETIKTGRRKGRTAKAPGPTSQNAKVNVPSVTDDPASVTAEAVDPVLSLDAEITRLRAELSEKLRLQNGQLRERLKRFEPR